GTFRVGRRPDSSPGLALVTPVGPFSVKAGGLLAAVTGDGLRVRSGAIVGRTGHPVLEAAARLEGPLGGLLLKVSGPGSVLLADAGRIPFLRTLSRESLTVEPTRLLAFEETLTYREDPAFERRRGFDRPFLKLTGTGAVALSGLSEAARFEVEWGQPLTLVHRVVVAWSGELVPELLEAPEAGAGFEAGPVIRFVGAGYVLADAR
ncbi:MAG TPA: AIM24 family protein, partial [Thermoanaerobaculia bacterium]|nr:AIM24 family protein [Thermoanaerobaculia bacterium]